MKEKKIVKIIIAVLLIFVVVATGIVLFNGIKNIAVNKEDEVVVEAIIHGNQYAVVTTEDDDIFSSKFWENIDRIEFYEGTDIPYTVSDENVFQEIGKMFSNLEYTKVDAPMLEGGCLFELYTEDGMYYGTCISGEYIEFCGIYYKVPTEILGDKIHELIMTNHELNIIVKEYVTNDYRINILDYHKDLAETVDVRIGFLTDKEKKILQNTLNVETSSNHMVFVVKLVDETERTKAVTVTSDGYELSFKFDVNTCEVFEVKEFI